MTLLFCLGKRQQTAFGARNGRFRPEIVGLLSHLFSTSFCAVLLAFWWPICCLPRFNTISVSARECGAEGVRRRGNRVLRNVCAISCQKQPLRAGQAEFCKFGLRCAFFSQPRGPACFFVGPKTGQKRVKSPRLPNCEVHGSGSDAATGWE